MRSDVRLFAKKKADDWQYVKWSEPVQSALLTGRAIAETLDGGKTCKKEAELGTPSLRQGDRDSGLPSGEKEASRPT